MNIYLVILYLSAASTLLVFLVIAVSALVIVEGTQNEQEIAAWRESVCGYVTLVGRRSSQLKDLVVRFPVRILPNNSTLYCVYVI